MKKYFEVGQRLRKLRGDIPQKVYAKRVGVSYRAYQNYESGERIPQAKTLNKIATKEFVTVDWILTGELRSLWEKVLTGEAEVSFLKKEINQLNKEVINDLCKKGISIPKNINSFVETGLYLKKQGKLQEFFDLLMLDKSSLLFIMTKQIERILSEGNKTKIKTLRGFLNTLDPSKMHRS